MNWDIRALGTTHSRSERRTENQDRPRKSASFGTGFSPARRADQFHRSSECRMVRKIPHRDLEMRIHDYFPRSGISRQDLRYRVRNRPGTSVADLPRKLYLFRGTKKETLRETMENIRGTANDDRKRKSPHQPVSCRIAREFRQESRTGFGKNGDYRETLYSSGHQFFFRLRGTVAGKGVFLQRMFHRTKRTAFLHPGSGTLGTGTSRNHRRERGREVHIYEDDPRAIGTPRRLLPKRKMT